MFYNEKGFVGLGSDGKQFALYPDAASKPNPFGNHFLLKIINRRNLCEFLASADGKAWTSLAGGVDVSGLNHNKLGGFLSVRPALMAAGRGEVKFNRFEYQPLP